MEDMLVRSGIYGPFRPTRRPRGRLLAQEAYLLLGLLAGLGYLVYVAFLA